MFTIWPGVNTLILNLAPKRIEKLICCGIIQTLSIHRRLKYYFKYGLYGLGVHSNRCDWYFEEASASTTTTTTPSLHTRCSPWCGLGRKAWGGLGRGASKSSISTTSNWNHREIICANPAQLPWTQHWAVLHIWYRESKMWKWAYLQFRCTISLLLEWGGGGTLMWPYRAWWMDKAISGPYGPYHQCIIFIWYDIHILLYSYVTFVLAVIRLGLSAVCTVLSVLCALSDNDMEHLQIDFALAEIDELQEAMNAHPAVATEVFVSI